VTGVGTGQVRIDIGIRPLRRRHTGVKVCRRVWHRQVRARTALKERKEVEVAVDVVVRRLRLFKGRWWRLCRVSALNYLFSIG